MQLDDPVLVSLNIGTVVAEKRYDVAFGIRHVFLHGDLFPADPLEVKIFCRIPDLVAFTSWILIAGTGNSGHYQEYNQ